MTKQEFLENINAILPDDKKVNAITDEEYKIIDIVYAFHPSISNVNGKEEIARLYVDYGFIVIADMYTRAKAAELIDRKRVVLNSSLAELDSDSYLVETGSPSELNRLIDQYL